MHVFALVTVVGRDAKSERRALDAPQVRRLFSRSPRDPRYHMLQHLSPKFRLPPVEREPRAALILNRFTRTLTIMFATDAVASILGVPADQVQHKSFYECIRETCLDDALKCIESAKANDSIAYLRFWSRDPRRPEDFEEEDSNVDEESTIDDVVGRNGSEGPRHFRNGTANSPYPDQNGSGSGLMAPNQQRRAESRRSSDSEGGGVKLDGAMDLDSNSNSLRGSAGPSIKIETDVDMQDGITSNETSGESRTTSSNALGSSSRATRYQTPLTPQSPPPPEDNVSQARGSRNHQARHLAPSVELEAVVSCTSDGLVVILRRARPQIPSVEPPQIPSTLDHGVFAAPWAQQPVYPRYHHEAVHNFQAPYAPHHMPLRSGIQAVGGPPMDQLMQSIRDVAVFAWALVGINGNIASYGHGQPSGEAQPPDGLPIWDPEAGDASYEGPYNQAAQRWAQEAQRQQPSFHQQDSVSTEFSMEETADYSTTGLGYQNHAANGHGNPWCSQTSAHQRNQEAFAQNSRQHYQDPSNMTASPVNLHPSQLSDGQHWLGNPQVPTTSAEDHPHNPPNGWN
ncbi:hypothetical protein FPCIR_11677 [Fusarium pseudocircinatum]|uniref:PAS domain-containing protein n=1 Tax=Fusarium pseudocircinatum TaxID=56676 RepID=A0A8H5KS00_9HYPO|nr:hypothetical protein FPCIR_11677 [Fusarium pseudocircinatum]